MTKPKMINIHDAKTHLSRLLDNVRAGEEIILAKAGKPYARLIPYQQSDSRPLGFVHGSLPDTFFEPLPAEELEHWQ